MLFGLQSSLHPFFTHPTYRKISVLPLAVRVAALRTAQVRAALVAEEPHTRNPLARGLTPRSGQMFPLREVPAYAPPPSASVQAIAAREGRSPQECVPNSLHGNTGRNRAEKR